MINVVASIKTVKLEFQEGNKKSDIENDVEGCDWVRVKNGRRNQKGRQIQSQRSANFVHTDDALMDRPKVNRKRKMGTVEVSEDGTVILRKDHVRKRQIRKGVNDKGMKQTNSLFGTSETKCQSDINTKCESSDIETRCNLFDTSLVASGHFHQSDKQFGSSSGKQCKCNGLMSMIYSKTKSPNTWNRDDLDGILLRGNCLYESITDISACNHDLLQTSDLPCNIEDGKHEYTVHYAETVNGYVTELEDQQKDAKFLPLSAALEETLDKSDVTFVNFGNETLSVMSLCDGYYIFDPHSRNHSGIDVGNGTSILMHAKSYQGVHKYIIQLALSMNYQCNGIFEIMGATATGKSENCVSPVNEQHDPKYSIEDMLCVSHNEDRVEKISVNTDAVNCDKESCVESDSDVIKLTDTARIKTYDFEYCISDTQQYSTSTAPTFLKDNQRIEEKVENKDECLDYPMQFVSQDKDDIHVQVDLHSGKTENVNRDQAFMLESSSTRMKQTPCQKEYNSDNDDIQPTCLSHVKEFKFESCTSDMQQRNTCTFPISLNAVKTQEECTNIHETSLHKQMQSVPQTKGKVIVQDKTTKKVNGSEVVEACNSTSSMCTSL